MLAALLAAACAAPAVQLRSPEPWSRQDQAALTRATAACGYYYPASPCLKIFMRVIPGTYRAVCAKP